MSMQDVCRADELPVNFNIVLWCFCTNDFTCIFTCVRPSLSFNFPMKVNVFTAVHNSLTMCQELIMTVFTVSVTRFLVTEAGIVIAGVVLRTSEFFYCCALNLLLNQLLGWQAPVHKLVPLITGFINSRLRETFFIYQIIIFV